MAWLKPNNSVIVDVLKGKKIAVIGSSSSDTTKPIRNFWLHIEDRTECEILNYANAGSRLTSNTQDYSTDSINQIKRVDDLPASNVDLVVIQPAINDEINSYPVGVFENETDVTTVYGALHVMCRKLYDKYPTVPFGFMTGQYAWVNTNETSVYHDAIKRVCAYYNIPVCDLKSEGRTPYTIADWQSVYASDRKHLNLEGNIVLSRRVESFVRMLLVK